MGSTAGGSKAFTLVSVPMVWWRLAALARCCSAAAPYRIARWTAGMLTVCAALAISCGGDEPVGYEGVPIDSHQAGSSDASTPFPPDFTAPPSSVASGSAGAGSAPFGSAESAALRAAESAALGGARAGARGRPDPTSAPASSSGSASDGDQSEDLALEATVTTSKSAYVA